MTLVQDNSDTLQMPSLYEYYKNGIDSGINYSPSSQLDYQQPQSQLPVNHPIDFDLKKNKDEKQVKNQKKLGLEQNRHSLMVPNVANTVPIQQQKTPSTLQTYPNPTKKQRNNNKVALPNEHDRNLPPT